MRFFRGRTWFSSLVEIRWHLTGQLLCWTTQGSTQPEQKTWPHGVVSGSSRTLLHKLHLKSGSTVPLKRSNSNPMVSLNPETNLWTPHPRRSKSEEQWGVFLLAGHWWSVRRDLLAPSSPHCLNSTNWPRLFGAFRSASYANSLKLEVRSFSPWKIDIFRFLCTQKNVFCNCKGKGEIRKRWQFLGPFMTRKTISEPKCEKRQTSFIPSQFSLYFYIWSKLQVISAWKTSNSNASSLRLRDFSF